MKKCCESLFFSKESAKFVFFPQKDLPAARGLMPDETRRSAHFSLHPPPLSRKAIRAANAAVKVSAQSKLHVKIKATFLNRYPTRWRLSSRILSAIIAINSLLVGLPRRLWMV